MSSVAELRETFNHENQLWKNGQPWRKARVATAYNNLFRAQCAEGNPPDALVRRNGNETERFMERVIVGLDGHSYWDGAESGFTKNDGRTRNARLWWWEHHYGPLEVRAVVKPVCGEPHCVTPEHQQMSPWSDYRMRYTDAQCAGALQVAALRIGRSPTQPEYDTLGLRPSSGLLKRRYASWNRALASAGLPPSGKVNGADEQRVPESVCVEALRHAAAELGYPPTGRWWSAKKMSPSEGTIRRRFGGWSRALEAAGLA